MFPFWRKKYWVWFEYQVFLEIHTSSATCHEVFSNTYLTYYILQYIHKLYYLQWCRSWFEDPHDMWCTFSCMDISYVCPINNANIWPFFGLLRDASALASIKTPNIILEKMTGPNIADKKGDSGAEGVISGFKFLNIGQATWYSIN